MTKAEATPGSATIILEDPSHTPGEMDLQEMTCAKVSDPKEVQKVQEEFTSVQSRAQYWATFGGSQGEVMIRGLWQDARKYATSLGFSQEQREELDRQFHKALVKGVWVESSYHFENGKVDMARALSLTAEGQPEVGLSYFQASIREQATGLQGMIRSAWIYFAG